MVVVRFVLALIVTVIVTVFLGGCGGGHEDPAESIRVEVLGFTELGSVRLRLCFTDTDGFLWPVAVGDEIVWHSGMIHANQKSAPRARVIQEADGSLCADVVLNYTSDRGVFGVVPAGSALTLSNGQPANYMLVAQWQLLPGMTEAPLEDGTGRVWIDVRF